MSCRTKIAEGFHYEKRSIYQVVYHFKNGSSKTMSSLEHGSATYIYLPTWPSRSVLLRHPAFNTTPLELGLSQLIWMYKADVFGTMCSTIAPEDPTLGWLPWIRESWMELHTLKYTTPLQKSFGTLISRRNQYFFLIIDEWGLKL